MLAYFVVVFSLVAVGTYKILTMKGSGAELPLSGFDDKPKPGMRCLNKIRELFRKIIRDKVGQNLVIHSIK